MDMSQPEPDALSLTCLSQGIKPHGLSESCPADPRAHNWHFDRRPNAGMAAAVRTED